MHPSKMEEKRKQKRINKSHEGLEHLVGKITKNKLSNKHFEKVFVSFIFVLQTLRTPAVTWNKGIVKPATKFSNFNNDLLVRICFSLRFLCGKIEHFILSTPCKLSMNLLAWMGFKKYAAC